MPPEAVAQLETLQSSVVALLTRAVKYGSVLIITNAETGWVELSCKKFMPRVLPYLQNLRILSARSTFEALYPDSPSAWKVSYCRVLGSKGNLAVGCCSIHVFPAAVQSLVSAHWNDELMRPSSHRRSKLSTRRSMPLT